MTKGASPAVTPPVPPADGPPGFHLLAKPSGSTCNIDCTYCCFLSKEALYPNEKSRMSEVTLDTYLRRWELYNEDNDRAESTDNLLKNSLRVSFRGAKR